MNRRRRRVVGNVGKSPLFRVVHIIHSPRLVDSAAVENVASRARQAKEDLGDDVSCAGLAVGGKRNGR